MIKINGIKSFCVCVLTQLARSFRLIPNYAIAKSIISIQKGKFLFFFLFTVSKKIIYE